MPGISQQALSKAARAMMILADHWIVQSPLQKWNAYQTGLCKNAADAKMPTEINVKKTSRMFPPPPNAAFIYVKYIICDRFNCLILCQLEVMQCGGG